MPSTTTNPAQLVTEGYEAFGRGDMATIADMFAVTEWNHRNNDRFAGIKRGFDEIGPFLGESVQLTDGTLQVLPKQIMADGETVVALVHMLGSRPDGRRLDDLQVHVLRVRDGRVASFDQYVGDPDRVAAFWA
jgi:ketosteroid isomerase-like protein